MFQKHHVKVNKQKLSDSSWGMNWWLSGVIKNIMIMTVVNVPYFSSFIYWQLWGGGGGGGLTSFLVRGWRFCFYMYMYTKECKSSILNWYNEKSLKSTKNMALPNKANLSKVHVLLYTLYLVYVMNPSCTTRNKYTCDTVIYRTSDPISR